MTKFSEGEKVAIPFLKKAIPVPNSLNTVISRWNIVRKGTKEREQQFKETYMFFF